MDRERIQHKILGSIGRGTRGKASKADDLAPKGIVAIKTRSAGVGAREPMTGRFDREALPVTLPSQPRIVTIPDFGEAFGLQVVVPTGRGSLRSSWLCM